MPAFETMDLYDDAVLWAATARVDRNGEPLVLAPVDVKCRWVERQSEITNPDGTNVGISVEVVVARAVPENSRMWRGTLDEWLGSGSSGDETQVLTVVAGNTAGSLHARFTRRTVMLSKFKQVPQV